ncbi:DUF4279 domain-containing protein [Fundidesulfovibrio terrae]|uniref:DUF4279 domain-containing protein n=1 Tax=Fundidesulfovibrio terrae TaxID=2922866 RepID=UPI001FAEC46D|nr:DUF4279 domain-containing protein [Fundidesulfovibrio terrae]
MAQLHRSAATLRIMGDELIPQSITKLLGCEPTSSHTKGQVVGTTSTGKEIVRKSGMWRLEATDCEPEDLNKQVAEILGKLPNDPGVWAQISKQFRMDLTCGFFMNESNEGVVISIETLLALGQRGIELDLDIYGPTQNINICCPCPCGSGQTYGECCVPKLENSRSE